METLERELHGSTFPISSLKRTIVFSLTIILIIFYDFIHQNMMHVLGAQLQKEFNLSETSLGFVSSSYFYTELVVIFFAGMILDSFSQKKIIIISLLFSIIGAIVFLFYSNIYTMFIWRIAVGICSAFTLTGVIKISLRYFMKTNSAAIISYIGAVSMLAGIASQFPIYILASYLGWRKIILIDLLGGICIIQLVRSLRYHLDRTELKRISFMPIKKIFTNSTNWSVSVFSCLINLPLFVLGALWGSFYLTEVFNLNEAFAVFVITIMYIAYMIGAPVQASIFSRYLNNKLIIIIGALIYLICFTFLQFSTTLSSNSLIILFFMIGFSSSVQPIAWGALIEENHRMGIGSGISTSFLSFISLLGGAIVQPLFGIIVDHSINKQTGFINTGNIILISAIFCLILAVYSKNIYKQKLSDKL